MRSIRLASVLIGLLALTFTVRVGDFIVQLASGEPATLQKSEAIASEEGEAKDKKSDKGEDKKAQRQEIPPKSDKKTDVKGLEQDSFITSAYSEEEVKVLQSLSQRREQLNKRERDIDQREKMLQAAEKKVD